MGIDFVQDSMKNRIIEKGNSFAKTKTIGRKESLSNDTRNGEENAEAGLPRSCVSKWMGKKRGGGVGNGTHVGGGVQKALVLLASTLSLCVPLG